ncbi:hypothetical protein HDU76_003646, partial [Blyttiomyces sp. JEL0837]
RQRVTAQEVALFDIVVTDYEVLRREVHFAKGDHERSRRQERVYERTESLLMEVEWWRVCLDEAQMVESPTAQVSEMARMIPRIHPWAITGTPITKCGLSDLYGLCLFLDLEPIAQNKSLFDKLLTPELRPHLITTFGRLMHRHTKDFLKDELALPQQTQYIVELEFSLVERHYYDELLQRSLEEIKTGAIGARQWTGGTGTLRRGRVPRAEEDSGMALRSLLLQLRQTCCHPQIGERNRQTLGEKLRSIDEVLELMYAQSLSTVVSVEKSLLGLKIHQAQMNEFLKEFDKSIAIYNSILVDTRRRIDVIKAELISFKKSNTKRKEVDHDDLDALSDFSDEEGNIMNTGGGEQEQEEGLEDSRVSLGSIAEYRQSLTLNLHSYKDMEHRVVFFIACCYHSMKDEQQENTYYDLAERIRREILGDYERTVENLQRRILSKGGESGRRRRGEELDESIQALQRWRVQEQSQVVSAGIVVKNPIDIALRLLKSLDRQWSIVIGPWRQRIIELLSTGLETPQAAVTAAASEKTTAVVPDKNDNSRTGPGFGLETNSDTAAASIPASDAATGSQSAAAAGTATDGNHDGQPTGEEYNKGIEIQVELDSLLDVYADALNDRREILLGIPYTQARNGLQLTLTDLQKKLMEMRRKYTLEYGSPHFAGVLKELKSAMDSPHLVNVEREICSMAIKVFHKGSDIEGRILGICQKELVSFRRLANARIQYYEQLQRLSDDVTPATRPHDLMTEVERTLVSIAIKERLLVAKMGRSRYLKNLIEAQTGGSKECIICRCTFYTGAMTSCGHVYCQECMRLWILKHFKCALCNTVVSRKDITAISMTTTQQTSENPPKALTLPEAGSAGEEVTGKELEQSHGSTPFITLPASQFNRISALKINGSFGTKFDFIIRHIMYIRSLEPDAKVLIFSQWSQVLDILSTACDKNFLKYVRIDGQSSRKNDAIRKFREDVTIPIFMLHSKSQSSGLTLVAARHVFLVEPVLNPGMEMQAINRVHRRDSEPTKQQMAAKRGAAAKGIEIVEDSEVRWCLFGNSEENVYVGQDLDQEASDDVDNSNAGPSGSNNNNKSCSNGNDDIGAATPQPAASDLSMGPVGSSQSSAPVATANGNGDPMEVVPDINNPGPMEIVDAMTDVDGSEQAVARPSQRMGSGRSVGRRGALRGGLRIW